MRFLHACFKSRPLFTIGLRRAALVAVLLLGTPTDNVYAATAPASLSKVEKARIEVMLTDELQRIVNTQKRIEGQGTHVTVKVRLDTRTEMIVVDLGKNYVPRYYGDLEVEGLLRELTIGASDLLMGIISIQGVEFRYGGKEIYHYFPDERPPNSTPRKNATGPAASTTVVVAAGHGAYFHYGYNDWRFQRDPFNGIQEDLITPTYAEELTSWMEERSRATILSPRSHSTTALHTPSGKSWWQIAARYNLEATFPDNSSIWNSGKYPSTAPLRDYYQDINSRPRFANHVGASTLIHLHTNGLPGNPTASGTRLFHHAGRAVDQSLGNSILCCMKELIHAKEPYENYTVPDQSTAATDNGENSQATMPSVIVEVGFHTNASDAAALEDPVFRTAAMKGVEKGYRLNAENKPCEPFGIASIPNAAGPQNEPIQHIVNYRGFPQFPVKAKMEFVSCQSGWTCNHFEVTFASSVLSPLVYTTTCRVASPRPPASFRVRTTLIDDDGVKADPVEHSYTCTTPAT
ncbi:MAG: N-acetylmuramoyl-L-alanine amidase [Burkholderiaceae bacterium]|nr:N-acetylmuramoyl-L-alanine amidase [Burkholderiaceae bacterium]